MGRHREKRTKAREWEGPVSAMLHRELMKLASEKTLSDIARESGVSYSSLHAFLFESAGAHQGRIRIDQVDALVSYLKLEFGGPCESDG